MTHIPRNIYIVVAPHLKSPRLPCLLSIAKTLAQQHPLSSNVSLPTATGSQHHQHSQPGLHRGRYTRLAVGVKYGDAESFGVEQIGKSTKMTGCGCSISQAVIRRDDVFT
ncbi:hypothetical protein R6Q57_024042 [Mikania cordata]